MATVVTTYWVNPLTDSYILPEAPGEVLNAAIAYWEDELMEWRAKRPRQEAVKQEKQRRVTAAAERLERFRRARDQYGRDFRKLDKLTLELATGDLRPVMKRATAERAA